MRVNGGRGLTWRQASKSSVPRGLRLSTPRWPVFLGEEVEWRRGGRCQRLWGTISTISIVSTISIISMQLAAGPGTIIQLGGGGGAGTLHTGRLHASIYGGKPLPEAAGAVCQRSAL